MNIKRILLTALITFSAFIYSQAQTATCSLRLEQLTQPAELFGIRVGMTDAEVKRVLPLIPFGRADRLGVMRTTFNPHFDSRVDQTAFPDVRTISLDFLDGRLATLWIGYEATFKWPKLDEFVKNYSKSLGVPSDWPTKASGRELACGGFSVFAVMIGGGPSIRINDEAAQAVFDARRQAAFEADENEVIGDIRSKRYYPSDCSARDSVPQNVRIVFKNKEEAEKAGYSLAKDCS